MLNQLRTALRMFKTEGVRFTLQFAVARIDEERYERRFNIRTHGYFTTASLQIPDPDSVFYLPTSYPGFFRAMRHVSVEGAFVDYGCGLGRALIAAATFPFTRVTGLELSAQVAARAQENIARARGMRCPEIELIRTHAASWQVPDDVRVFHFYNPFGNPTLRSVLTDIARSLRTAPRRVWILFAFPIAMEPLMCEGEVIPHAWQQRAVDEVWPLFPIRKDDLPRLTSYRIYTVDSRSGAEAGGAASVS
jgi:SAM-dependent methyltransferase